MVKLASMVTSDLEAAYIKIKTAYVLELETEHDRYKELLKAQLLEADEAKEKKKLDLVKARRLAEIVAEVNNTFAELEIPE